MKRLVTEPPASFRVKPAGKAVKDRIDIGTDVKTPHISVVTDIHYNLYLLFRNNSHQSTQKLGGAGPSGKDSIVGGTHLIILRGPTSPKGLFLIIESIGRVLPSRADWITGNAIIGCDQHHAMNYCLANKNSIEGILMNMRQPCHMKGGLFVQHQKLCTQLG
jgi:hypothetical protein